MKYHDMEPFIQLCIDAEGSAQSWTARWCDERRFSAENSIDVSPGEFLNRYGYYVVGTTVGGNAVAVSDSNDAVVYAGHSWYSDDCICFQDLQSSKEWIEIPWSPENFLRSLFPLARSRQELIRMIRTGELTKVLDEID
jgi:hypothetical protein